MPDRAGSTLRHPCPLLGVGIDLAERTTFAHLGEAAIWRAAGRWLRLRERVWCAAQPSLREAVVIVLSCKEAAYKAGAGAVAAHELSLAMQGHGTAGRAVLRGPRAAQVVVSWELCEGSVRAFAVAARGGAARGLAERVLVGWQRALPRHLIANSDVLPRHLGGRSGGVSAPTLCPNTVQ